MMLQEKSVFTPTNSTTPIIPTVNIGNTLISIAGFYGETISDGIGVRASVYGAGCSHACKGCHNPQTWDVNNGTWVSVQEVFEALNLSKNSLLRGVTFSGGDPMYQAKAFSELARLVKTVPQKSIWCYTGYLFEEIACNQDDKYELLTHVDVLVDGRFMYDIRDISLPFRGSPNQRIIDVQQSLKQGAVIEYHLPKFL